MSRTPRGALLFVLLAVLVLTAERRLKHDYYSQTYRYYDAGEVYWEDSHTLLLFSPDRYLFWRLKPGIRMNQYGAYVVGTRPVPYAFEVKTDSRGFNSPEFDCAGKRDTFRKEPLYVDDMHPNALGHEIVARRLYEDLVRVALVR